MSDDTERILERLCPRGAPPELRQRVLEAVGKGLAAGPTSRWGRRWGLAVAAGLLLGVSLNVWAVRTVDRRLARLYGPTPVPRQITEYARTVEAVTDAATAHWMEEQLYTVYRQRHKSSPPAGLGSWMNDMSKL